MKTKISTLTIIALLGTASALSACGKDKDARFEAKAEKMMSKLPTEYVQGQKTFETAQAFLRAAGSGDGETLSRLMADDFVWHNEGDKTLPWIGNWEGKEKVLTEFMPAFGAGLTATSWTTDYSFASGDQAVFMGSMSAVANRSGVETGSFSWAVRVHVENGKVKSWNWFEDSFAVSQAYHNASK